MKQIASILRKQLAGCVVKPCARNVLPVTIFCCKIYFVFFIFMVYTNHESNKNFQIYGTKLSFVVNHRVLLWPMGKLSLSSTVLFKPNLHPLFNQRWVFMHPLFKAGRVSRQGSPPAMFIVHVQYLNDRSHGTPQVVNHGPNADNK